MYNNRFYRVFNPVLSKSTMFYHYLKENLPLLLLLFVGTLSSILPVCSLAETANSESVYKQQVSDIKVKKDAWKYDSSKEYDIYYADGDNSIYHKLYKDKFIPFDKWVIKSILNDYAEEKNNLSIIDFGSGDGRYFPIFEDIAKDLGKKNKTLTLIAYDPSYVAFDQYYKRVTKLGFKIKSRNFDDNNNFKVTELTKDNFTVKLICPFDLANIKYLESVTGKTDVIICMFGVLSHIQTKEQRIDTLKILGNIVDREGTLLISAPSYKILPEERFAFEVLRKNKINFQINNQKTTFAKGDLIYSRNLNNKHVENFFHVYESSDEVLAELKEAGLKTHNDIGINKMFHETTLINYPLIGYLDGYLSRLFSFILPKIVKDKIASYYLIKVSK